MLYKRLIYYWKIRADNPYAFCFLIDISNRSARSLGLYFLIIIKMGEVTWCIKQQLKGDKKRFHSTFRGVWSTCGTFWLYGRWEHLWAWWILLWLLVWPCVSTELFCQKSQELRELTIQVDSNYERRAFHTYDSFTLRIWFLENEQELLALWIVIVGEEAFSLRILKVDIKLAVSFIILYELRIILVDRTCHFTRCGMSSDRRACYGKTNYMRSVCWEFSRKLFETGHVIVTTKVVERSLNYFGVLMGDICLRFVTRSQGSWPFQQVTMRWRFSLISIISKAGHLSDQLKIEEIVCS